MIGIGEIAAIGNMVFTGISNVIVKSQGKKIKPFALISIQTVVAGFSYFIISLITNEYKDMLLIGWKAFLPLFFAAFMGIFIGNIFYYKSLQMIGVSKAYPVSMTYPLLTYIFEIAFFEEQFQLIKLSGIILCIIGVVVISFSKKNNETVVTSPGENPSNIIVEEEQSKKVSEQENIKSKEKNQETPSKILSKKDQTMENDSLPKSEKSTLFSNFNKTILIGIGLSLFAALTWASGTTLIKFGLDNTEVGIIPINSARILLLVPFSFVSFLLTNKGERKSKFSWKGVLLIALSAILGNVISNLLYLFSIKQIGGTSTPAAISSSGPLIATPLSIIFLKEKIDWKVIVGTLLTIGGILIILLIK